MSVSPIRRPEIFCHRRQFAEVSADPGVSAWSGLAGAAFQQAVSGEAPVQGTTVRLGWDENDLRVLFDIEDNHIHATLTKRDALLYEEEVVEVFLDPFGDLETYFEIEINPLNAVLDLVLRKNRSGYVKDMAWQCEGLRTAVRRHDRGWSAELIIPFRSLTTEPISAGTCWRVNFCRIDRPPGVERELTAWSPPGRANFHTPERFGSMIFVDEHRSVETSMPRSPIR